MVSGKNPFEIEHFNGDYSGVKHFVKTRRFACAAEPLIVGLGYQSKRELVADTTKHLTQTWHQKQKLMKEMGYTTDDIVEDVLIDVEEWLRELHNAGKIKKVDES
jgi:hypothetical protein